MDNIINQHLANGKTPAEIALMIKESDDPFVSGFDKLKMQQALSRAVIKMHELQQSYSEGSKFE